MNKFGPKRPFLRTSLLQSSNNSSKWDVNHARQAYNLVPGRTARGLSGQAPPLARTCLLTSCCDAGPRQVHDRLILAHKLRAPSKGEAMGTEPAVLTCPVCRGDRISVVKDKGVYCAECNRIYPASRSRSLASTVKDDALRTPNRLLPVACKALAHRCPVSVELPGLCL